MIGLSYFLIHLGTCLCRMDVNESGRQKFLAHYNNNVCKITTSVSYKTPILRNSYYIYNVVQLSSRKETGEKIQQNSRHFVVFIQQKNGHINNINISGFYACSRFSAKPTYIYQAIFVYTCVHSN